MSRVVFAALDVVAGVAAFAGWRRAGSGSVSAAGGSIEKAFEQGVDYMNNAAGQLAGQFGFFKMANMGAVDRSLVNHPNVRAMFAVVRRGEGTSGENGYNTIYGGGTFSGFADHPRKSVTKWGRTSTAAGAYQALSSVWDETRQAMGLRDFSPASQDMFALGRIAMRGVLSDVLAGRLEKAIAGNGSKGHGLRWEWASMPGSPYGQGVISMETARKVFMASGGSGPVYA